MSEFQHPDAEAINAYWAERFECSPELVSRPGLHLLFSENADPARIAVLELHETTLVRAHDEHADSLSSWFSRRTGDDPRSAEAVSKAFPDHCWNVSSSEKVFYLDPSRFQPFQHAGVRQLSEDDSRALTEMHRGCTLDEQKAGEVNIDHPAIFGAFAKNRLAAAASLIDQDERISDVGILVHRDFRRQGYGRAAVSALCRWGLGNQRIVQYWRLCANTGSARIADSLGFSEYGRFQVLNEIVSPMM